MDKKTIDQINQAVKESLQEAILKRPTPKDEAVVIHTADGRRVELHSSQESINRLLPKASKKLQDLKETNGNKHLGYIQ